MTATTVSRRTVLKVMGGVGAGLVLGSFVSLGCEKKADSDFEPSAFLKVHPDNSVTLTVPKPDMGQGVRTSLAMLIAEELDVDWKSVKVEQAAGDGDAYGSEGTGGSNSIRSTHRQMREVGAAARAMLVAAAAAKWGVDASTCTTSEGTVHHAATGKSATYGSLAGAASTLPAPGIKTIKLKDPKDFKIIGKPTRRVDNAAVTKGQPLYGMDVTPKGMVYAVLLRRSPLTPKMDLIDDSEARKVPGVLDVLRYPGGFAIIAENTWAGIKGRDAMKVQRDLGENADLSTASVREGLLKEVVPHPDMTGAKVLEATFDLPYLAHAAMEPMNVVIDLQADHCEIWVGTQAPDAVQEAVAKELRLPKNAVQVNTMLMGGSFGRKGRDFVMEGLKIAALVKKPVKVFWTREEDMQDDGMRPMSHHTLKGALDENGAPLAWSHQFIEAGGRNHAVMGNPGLYYTIPSVTMRRDGSPCKVSVGSWRSTENSAYVAANECFFDELAHAAGQDSLEYRLKYVSNPRVRGVLEEVAKQAGWGTPMPKGSGRGIAAFSGYGSFIAHVVEASVVDGKIRVDKVFCAVDCGLAVNPLGVEALCQGACCDALATSLRAAVTFDKGMMQQTNWDTYRWMTLDAMPDVHVTIIKSGAEPGGMGETGYPSVSPALANALFAVTGKRVRKFPIRLEEMV